MTTTQANPNGDPLWLLIEKEIDGLNDAALAADNHEPLVKKLAAGLDGCGFTVSTNGSYLLELRRAIQARRAVGKSLLSDINSALAALGLEDFASTGATAKRIITELCTTWPALGDAARRPAILKMVEDTKLDRLIKKAKTQDEEAGIRFLIAEDVAVPVIISAMDISEDRYQAVDAKIQAEKAERERVRTLLEAVAEQSEVERIKHLITNDVADALIAEMAGVDAAAIKDAKDAMTAELAEKQRLAEEEAARKKAEAEGPSLESISNDDMLEHIESIREILEFSDVENEIRTMCEQSAIPKCLVDIAVSNPDQLDELEAKAEG